MRSSPLTPTANPSRPSVTATAWPVPTPPMLAISHWVVPRRASSSRQGCTSEPVELLRLDDPRMLAVGQDASRLLLEAEHEFLRSSVVPAADTPGTDEISFTEFDLAPLQSRAPVLI